MTDSDGICSSDYFNFRGVPSFLQVCEKLSQPTQNKGATFACPWLSYISIAKFWVLDFQYVL